MDICAGYMLQMLPKNACIWYFVSPYSPAYLPTYLSTYLPVYQPKHIVEDKIATGAIG